MSTGANSDDIEASPVPATGLQQPKPPLALVVCALAVLAASVLFAAFAVMDLAVTWDPLSVASGVIFLPCSAGLYAAQYRAAFRGSVRAAETSALLLFVVGGFLLFGFATTLGEIVLDTGGLDLSRLSLLVPILSMGLFGCYAGWLNLRWAQRLKRFEASTGNSTRAPRWSRRDALPGIVTLACVAGLAIWFIQMTPPRYAEHVSADEAPFGLPAGATDVSFCHGYRGTIAFEFTVDEASFVEWVESGISPLESKSESVPLGSIDGPLKMKRCYALASAMKGPNSITITDGLYYGWTREDQGIYKAFDRNTGRAYCYKHYY